MTTDLKSRVAAQRAQQQDGTVDKAEPPKTIYQLIESMKDEIARALPKHLGADRLARIALTEVRRTPLLASCTQQSFGGALMTCAQLGLEPGVTGEAWLLPFKNSKKGGIYEVQLVIGYPGMVKLYWQSPLARSLDTQAVYEKDEFDYEYGLSPRLVHKPYSGGDRGPATHYYAVARLENGGSAFVVMSPWDVEKIRARSRAKDDGPWKTDYDAMARKTCLRQLFKLLPRSPELARAMAQDEAVRTNMTEEGIDVVPEYISGEVIPAGPDGREPDGDPPAPPAAKAQPEPPQRGGTGASRLGQAIAQVIPGTPADVAEFLAWRTGRAGVRLSDLSRTEVDAACAYLDGMLEAAQGDAAAAAIQVWAQVAAGQAAAAR